MNNLENEEDEDYFSPFSWEHDSFESDDDYEDRMIDQEDLIDYFND